MNLDFLSGIDRSVETGWSQTDVRLLTLSGQNPNCVMKSGLDVFTSFLESVVKQYVIDFFPIKINQFNIFLPRIGLMRNCYTIAIFANFLHVASVTGRIH